MATIIPYTNDLRNLKSTTKINKQPDYDNFNLDQNQQEQNVRIWKELSDEITGYAEHQLDKYRSQILDNTVDLDVLSKDIEAYTKSLLSKYKSYISEEFLQYFENVMQFYTDKVNDMAYWWSENFTHTYLYGANHHTNEIILNGKFLVEILKESIYINDKINDTY